VKARIQRLVQRAQATLPARVLIAYGESQASNYALALAFAGFMAMFPMMLGALSILGLAIRDPATEAHIQSLVLQVFPASAQPELEKALHGVKQSWGWLGIVSLAGLLWSAGSIFATMEFALTQIFGSKQRDMLRQRLMGLVMMLLLVAAIVVTVAINAVPAFFPLASWITWIIGFVAGAVVMIALLVALYRFVPNRTFRLTDVLPGAVLAGLLIEALSFAFPLYAKIAGGFMVLPAQPARSARRRVQPLPARRAGDPRHRGQPDASVAQQGQAGGVDQGEAGGERASGASSAFDLSARGPGGGCGRGPGGRRGEAPAAQNREPGLNSA